jgi:hypothetical protein
MRQNDLKKVSRFAPSSEADAAAPSCHTRPLERDDSFIMKRHALDVAVLVLSAAMIVAAVLSLHAEDAEKLPALGADLSQTSVSGHMKARSKSHIRVKSSALASWLAVRSLAPRPRRASSFRFGPWQWLRTRSKRSINV